MPHRSRTGLAAILATHEASAMQLDAEEAEARANGLRDPSTLGVVTAAQQWSVVQHIRDAMANRARYDREHDAKQVRECEPL